MLYPHIEHHGAEDGVTGSCHEPRMNASSSLLIDCGLFQGNDASIPDEHGTVRLDIEFPLDGINAVIAAHVHIDHLGRVPYLGAAGFDGPILCSEPAASLLPMVLEDAFKLSFSREQAQIDKDICLVDRRIVVLPYRQWFTLANADELLARMRLQRAGHVLGSSCDGIDLGDPQIEESKRVVFFGDLSEPHSPFLIPPEPPERAGTLVLESTYGNRLHEDSCNRRKRLESVIDQALADQSTSHPGFSIDRTQELLYELEDIINTKLSSASAPEGASVLASNSPMAIPGETNWPEMPAILDSSPREPFHRSLPKRQTFLEPRGVQPHPIRWSPACLRTTHHHGQPQRPPAHPPAFGQNRTTRYRNSWARHVQRWSHRQLPKKAIPADRGHNVLFVSYQSKATLGHVIQPYGPKGGYVDLDGERIRIRADITIIGLYSDHSDRKELVEFVTGMRLWPTEIR